MWDGNIIIGNIRKFSHNFELLNILPMKKILFVSMFFSLVFITGYSQDTASLQKGYLPKNAIWLENLDLSKMSSGWSQPEAGKTVDKNPIKLNGKTYQHGVGAHSYSEFIVDLFGEAEKFVSVAGVDDECIGKGDETKPYGTVVFEVWLDGIKSFTSGVVRIGEQARFISIDLKGVKRMVLVITEAGDGTHYDHADWAGAMILLKPDAKIKPVAFSYTPDPTAVIASTNNETPGIHGAKIVGSTPGKPFLYLIPATGKAPLTFKADNLPEGLVLDSKKGIISGVIRNEGKTQVEITMKAANGIIKSKIIIVAGNNKLSLTPPMGWNSWNVWGTAVDAQKVRDAADWMVKSGLAAHGYQSINIDDAWEGARDETGNITTNEKFGDIKALAEYIHSKGLKLGIYSSPGPTTCGGYEGSYKHELKDAQTYAKWGIDYLKYDWCSYATVVPDKSLKELQNPYILMKKALDTVSRDIIFSLCQYGMGDVWKWGESVGGNLWRTSGDINDTWSSMSYIATYQDGLEKYSGPGHWNDPDMLVVGKLGWSKDIHQTHLNGNEQISQITIWSILAAPMLMGCDLSQLDEFTFNLLSNDEVIAVNQDELGKQGYRIWQDEMLEVWAKPLVDGSYAVALWNRTAMKSKIKVNFKDIGESGSYKVRDLWLKKDLGSFTDFYEAEVPSHGAMLVKVVK